MQDLTPFMVEKANGDISRLDAQDQEIVVVKKGELYYVRNGQGNLAEGSLLPTQKPIYGEVDGQTQIVGYEDVPSNDVTVTTNAIFGGAGKDKILGLSDSDLLGGFGGNEGKVAVYGDGIGIVGAVDDAPHGADFIDGGAGYDYLGGQLAWLMRFDLMSGNIGLISKTYCRHGRVNQISTGRDMTTTNAKAPDKLLLNQYLLAHIPKVLKANLPIKTKHQTTTTGA